MSDKAYSCSQITTGQKETYFSFLCPDISIGGLRCFGALNHSKVGFIERYLWRELYVKQTHKTLTATWGQKKDCIFEFAGYIHQPK